jgi:hypothetical protein
MRIPVTITNVHFILVLCKFSRLATNAGIAGNDYDDVDILFVDPSPVLTTPGTTNPER